MSGGRGPTITRVAGLAGGSGTGCCCCCCCCTNLCYLISMHGIIKLAECVLASLCQSWLMEHGMPNASTIGLAFHEFLTIASACQLTTALLITCYVLSNNTQQLIRQSIFECLFNVMACFLYLSASSHMGYAVITYLYPGYTLSNLYVKDRPMTAVSVIGVVVGILHSVDAYLSCRYRLKLGLEVLCRLEEMSGGRGPRIKRVAGGSGTGCCCGRFFCCCCCCECNLRYLTSMHGIIKLAECILGVLCHSLLLKYGMPEASTIGSSFDWFLRTASACHLTNVLVITCYVLSKNTQQLIRQSIFECLFNAVACFLYVSASLRLFFAMNVNWQKLCGTFFERLNLCGEKLPDMTNVYYIGVVVGFLHGVDACLSYLYFKTYQLTNLLPVSLELR